MMTTKLSHYPLPGSGVVGQFTTRRCNRPGRQRKFTPRQSWSRQMEVTTDPVFTVWYPHPPPPCLMESWAWREFSALVFEK